MVYNMAKTTKYSQRVNSMIDLLKKDITNSIITGNDRLKEVTFGDIRKLAEKLIELGWNKKMPKKETDSMFG